MAPHVSMEHIAVPVPHGRRLATADDCASNPVTFKHGVASGDPLPTQVMIWTRVTPASAAQNVDHHLRYSVQFQVALDDKFTQVSAHAPCLPDFNCTGGGSP